MLLFWTKNTNYTFCFIPLVSNNSLNFVGFIPLMFHKTNIATKNRTFIKNPFTSRTGYVKPFEYYEAINSNQFTPIRSERYPIIKTARCRKLCARSVYIYGRPLCLRTKPKYICSKALKGVTQNRSLHTRLSPWSSQRRSWMHICAGKAINALHLARFNIRRHLRHPECAHCKCDSTVLCGGLYAMCIS